jgi:hypothetical protein
MIMHSLIETYSHNGDGYNPFFIREGWQVAQLNYLEEQDPEKITKIDKHLLTDEVFILLKGNAVLIAAAIEENDSLTFECIKMIPGITYNIPVKTWHNIAMDRDASIIIVEKNNTHLSDFVYRNLNNNERAQLKQMILETLENHKVK